MRQTLFQMFRKHKKNIGKQITSFMEFHRICLAFDQTLASSFHMSIRIMEFVTDFFALTKAQKTLQETTQET